MTKQSPAKLERWKRMHRRDHVRFDAFEEPCEVCDEPIKEQTPRHQAQPTS
jgi:hypothetical protein